MPEEIRFFGRLAVYGVAITAAYWFVSYDVLGTVLQGAFALAATFGGTAIYAGLRRTRRIEPGAWRPTRWLPLSPEGAGAGATDDDPALLPQSSLAPLQVGVGFGLMALGLVYGPWLVALGAAPVIVGGLAWAREAGEELPRDDEAAATRRS
jgi:hypothetical protein